MTATTPRLYSSAILGLLVISAVILLTVVPSLFVVARRADRARRAAVADVVAAEIAHERQDDVEALSRKTNELERRYGLAGVGFLEHQDNARLVIERRVVHGRTIEIRFHTDPVDQPRRLLQLATVTAVLALIGGLSLLFANMRTILRPDDAAAHPPDSAAEGTLFRTFETSIRSMKSRESELQRLRDQEKERADELAAVTRTLVRSLTSGFISIDPDGLIVDVNEQGRELLGVQNRSPQRQAVEQALGDSMFSRTLQRAVRDRATFQREEIADEKTGRVFGLTTVPLLDERGRYFGMLALFVDLSPMRKLEDRVRALQSLADLGEMSAGIAHEFRNSLSTVLGYIRLAKRDALPAEASERLSRAETEASHLNAAIESLLSFTRPVSLQLQQVDVMEIIRSIADQQAGVSGEVTIEVTGPPVVIDADSALLRRAFENILRNAAEAVQAKSATNGRIEIASMLSSESFRITISDNGAGLDSADAARLFLPFQSTKSTGFGLGLALTKKIILLHGGTIQLEGTKGAGATVTIDFAVAPLR